MEQFLVPFLVVGNIMGWSLAIWIANEMRKKFMFMDDFRRDAGNMACDFWIEAMTSLHGQKDRAGRKPGMNTFQLQADVAFTTLVGFKLVVPQWTRPLFRALCGRDSGFDYYGRVSSSSTIIDGRHTAYVTTWFGKNQCRFRFLSSTRGVKITLLKEPVFTYRLDDAHGVYPPHFYQKWLGWYA
ncbi:TPA: hypothetical protein DEB00_02985 [Candidatus Uhrbacteria bacterium]|nr:hypothetical protein [Candidatus Uhrbacteria bacterium]